MVVGEDQELRAQFIHYNRSSVMGAHSGIHATYQRLAIIFYQKGMWKIIREIIRQCETCQHFKPENIASLGQLQPLPIPQSIFVVLTIDFIGGLPKSKGTDIILVVGDRVTKYAYFIPLSHPITAVVAQMYSDFVYKLHGFHSIILSDRDPIFSSIFGRNFSRWKEWN